MSSPRDRSAEGIGIRSIGSLAYFDRFDRAVDRAIEEDWILKRNKTFVREGIIGEDEYAIAWRERVLEIVISVGRLV